jgi:hypothetical protein
MSSAPKAMKRGPIPKTITAPAGPVAAPVGAGQIHVVTQLAHLMPNAAPAASGHSSGSSAIAAATGRGIIAGPTAPSAGEPHASSVHVPNQTNDQPEAASSGYKRERVTPPTKAPAPKRGLVVVTPIPGLAYPPQGAFGKCLHKLPESAVMALASIIATAQASINLEDKASLLALHKMWNENKESKEDKEDKDMFTMALRNSPRWKHLSTETEACLREVWGDVMDYMAVLIECVSEIDKPEPPAVPMGDEAIEDAAQVAHDNALEAHLKNVKKVIKGHLYHMERALSSATLKAACEEALDQEMENAANERAVASIEAKYRTLRDEHKNLAHVHATLLADHDHQLGTLPNMLGKNNVDHGYDDDDDDEDCHRGAKKARAGPSKRQPPAAPKKSRKEVIADGSDPATSNSDSEPDSSDSDLSLSEDSDHTDDGQSWLGRTPTGSSGKKQKSKKRKIQKIEKDDWSLAKQRFGLMTIVTINQARTTYEKMKILLGNDKKTILKLLKLTPFKVVPYMEILNMCTKNKLSKLVCSYFDKSGADKPTKSLQTLHAVKDACTFLSLQEIIEVLDCLLQLAVEYGMNPLAQKYVALRDMVKMINHGSYQKSVTAVGDLLSRLLDEAQMAYSTLWQKGERDVKKLYPSFSQRELQLEVMTWLSHLETPAGRIQELEQINQEQRLTQQHAAAAHAPFDFHQWNEQPTYEGPVSYADVAAPSTPRVCLKFQQGTCFNGAGCSWSHACIICGHEHPIESCQVYDANNPTHAQAYGDFKAERTRFFSNPGRGRGGGGFRGRGGHGGGRGGMASQRGGLAARNGHDSASARGEGSQRGSAAVRGGHGAFGPTQGQGQGQGQGQQ